METLTRISALLYIFYHDSLKEVIPMVIVHLATDIIAYIPYLFYIASQYKMIMIIMIIVWSLCH